MTRSFCRPNASTSGRKLTRASQQNINRDSLLPYHAYLSVVTHFVCSSLFTPNPKLDREERAIVRWLHKADVNKKCISDEVNRSESTVRKITMNGYKEKDNIEEDWDAIGKANREKYMKKYGVSAIASRFSDT